MADIRREPGATQALQPRIAPVTEPSILPAVAETLNKTTDAFGDYMEGQRNAASEGNLTAFQMDLMNESLAPAKRDAALFDAAEQQGSMHPNAIRNNRLAKLAKYITADPANRAEYNKIFKNVINPISKEIEDAVEFNAKAEAARITEEQVQQRERLITSSNAQSYPPTAQQTVVNAQTQELQKIDAFQTKMANYKAMGVALSKDEMKAEAAQTIPGTMVLVNTLLTESLSSLPDIDTQEGRLGAQNLVQSLKLKTIAQIQQETGFTPTEIKDVYFAPLAKFDNALEQLSREGVTRLEMTEKNNTLLDAVTSSMNYNSEQARQDKFIIDNLMKIPAGSILATLITNGQSGTITDAISRMWRSAQAKQNGGENSQQSSRVTGTVGGSSGNTAPPGIAKPNLSSQYAPGTPAGNIDYAGLNYTDVNSVAKVVSTYVNNGAALNAKGVDANVTESQLVFNKLMVEGLMEANSNMALLSPEDVSTPEAQADLKLWEKPETVPMQPKHKEDRINNDLKNVASAMVGDMGATIGSGSIPGLQGVSNRVLQESLVLQVDPDTGKVTVAPLGEKGEVLPITTFKANSFFGSDKIRTRNVNLTHAINSQYSEAMTDMLRAISHGKNDNTDYLSALNEISAVISGAGGPRFITSDTLKEITAVKPDGSFEGQEFTFGEQVGKFFSGALDTVKELPQTLSGAPQEFFKTGSTLALGAIENGSQDITDIPVETSGKVQRAGVNSGKIDRSKAPTGELTLEELKAEAPASKPRPANTDPNIEFNKIKEPDPHKGLGKGFNKDQIEAEYQKVIVQTQELLDSGRIKYNQLPRVLQNALENG